jgi:hypothetical protein
MTHPLALVVLVGVIEQLPLPHTDICLMHPNIVGI